MINSNLNLEMMSVACLLQDGSLFPVVEDILEQKAYSDAGFGILFKSIKDIVYGDLYPDVTTVETDLDRKGLLLRVEIPELNLFGREALIHLSKMEVNVDVLESYAYQIQGLYALRQISTLINTIQHDLNDSSNPPTPYEILSKIDLETGKIASFVGIRSKTVKSAQDALNNALSDYDEATKGIKRFIETGIKAWDDFTNGLFKQRLYLIAARANEGKSALAHNFIYNLCVLRKVKVHLITLEMSAEEVNNRLIQIRTGISPLDIEKGSLKESEVPLYAESCRELSKASVTYDDSSELNLALLRTKIRKAVANGAELIVIDQLEMLNIGGSGDSQPEYIKINYITYRVKAFAREMDIPIILIHQMNRSVDGKERGKNPDPQLSDLAQAGEKAPDVVMMLRTTQDAAFFFVKNRQGKKGRADIKWEGHKIKFSDVDSGDQFPEKLL
jgi:replicative DNA helicase